MSDAEGGFSQSYAEARGKFLAAAEAAGLDVQTHPHPLPGRDGELLAMDVARLGPADADAVLLVTSACHGVEGYCGSGVQHALLQDAAFRRQAAEAGVAVVFVHALNPHGFSFWRRTTHENVDLNRNVHDFSKPLPENAAYEELAAWLVPGTWPPPRETEVPLQAWIAAHGERAYQSAVSGGQHRHPDGLFYGGIAPTWSQQTFRQVLRTQASACRRLGWIDLHTGLGPSGHGERIFACRDDAAALARARDWWGRAVTSIYDGSSTSALLTGLLWTTVFEECPQAEYTGIALEYGTVPILEVLEALRADQALQNHPEALAAQREAIKRRVRDAFYTDTPEWKRRIVEQGLDAARAGVKGLAAG